MAGGSSQPHRPPMVQQVVPPDVEPVQSVVLMVPPSLPQSTVALLAGRQKPPAASQTEPVPPIPPGKPPPPWLPGMSGAPAPSCDVSEEPGHVVEKGVAQPVKTASHVPA